jgi:hypothetical protein
MEGYHQYGGAKHAVILAQVQGQFELQSETVKKKKKGWLSWKQVNYITWL